MGSGFNEVKVAISNHVQEDNKAHATIDEMEKRLRSLEIESARFTTQMRIFCTILSLGSGGAGALISKLL